MLVMVLADGETYTALKGCKILEITEGETSLDEALLVKYSDQPNALSDLITEWEPGADAEDFVKTITRFA